MMALLSLSVFCIALFGLAIAFGVIALPVMVSGIVAAPLIFLYMMMLGSILWLAEINIFLGLVAFAFYLFCIWKWNQYLKARHSTAQ